MIDIGLIIGVVVALTQLIKQLEIDKKYLPVISLLLGVIAGIFYLDGDLKTQIFYGILVGLSASGLFDQSKIITKKGDK